MSRITSRNTKPGIIVRSIKKAFYAGNLDFLKKPDQKQINPDLSLKSCWCRTIPLKHAHFAPEYPDTFLRYIQDKFMRIHGKIYNISGNLHLVVQKRSAGKAGYCSAGMEDGNFCARVLPAPALISIDTPRSIC
jgi:hypothetical protein